MLIFGVLFMRRAFYPLCSLLYMSEKFRYTCTIKEGPPGMIAKNRVMRCKAPARLCGTFCTPDDNYIKQTRNVKTGVFLALWRCDAQSMQKPPVVYKPPGV